MFNLYLIILDERYVLMIICQVGKAGVYFKSIKSHLESESWELISLEEKLVESTTAFFFSVNNILAILSV